MIKTRIPCPVCLGVKMVKQSPPQRRRLTLDLCPRCGGIWFDAGELEYARTGTQFSLVDPSLVGIRTAKCQTCRASMDRNAECCPACGAPNHLDCPKCYRFMKRIVHTHATVDVCDKGHGVWFDRHEIAAVWTLALATALQTQSASSSHALQTTGDAAVNFVEGVAYSPDVGGLIVEGSVNAAGSLAEGLASVADVGAVAEAAGAVFEVLLEIVGAILGGLSL